jgi:hypothetical protein
VTRDDLVRFATRDWAAVEAGKAQYWAERKRGMTPAEALRLGDDLRRFAETVRPDWPTAAERAADHQVHERVTEALRAVVVFTR